MTEENTKLCDFSNAYNNEFIITPVRDITLRYDPPKRGWVIPLAVHYEEDQGSPRHEDDGSRRQAWIRPRARAYELPYVYLSCKEFISYKPSWSQCVSRPGLCRPPSPNLHIKVRHGGGLTQETNNRELG